MSKVLNATPAHHAATAAAMVVRKYHLASTTPGGDWKDAAEDGERALYTAWEDWMGDKPIPVGSSAGCAPRSFMAEAAKAWPVVEARIRKVLAALPRDEFRERCRQVRKDIKELENSLRKAPW